MTNQIRQAASTSPRRVVHWRALSPFGMSVLEGIALPASFLVFPYCSRFQYPLPAAYPPPQMPLAAPGRAAQCWDCLGCSFQLQSLCLNLLVLPPSRSCENRQPSPKSQYPLWYTSEAPEKSVKSGATGSIWRDFARIRATQCPPGTCGLESLAWATFWLIRVCGPLLLLTRGTPVWAARGPQPLLWADFT